MKEVVKIEQKRIESLYRYYESYLLKHCIPFWMKNSLDHQYGGYLTCLDGKGDVYNTDKSVWFQGRGTWMFSKLYNDVAPKQEWLNAAKSGYDFLVKHCFDEDKRMFFTVTQDGRPLQKRRYMFSETFAIIACAEYYKASGDPQALKLAKEIFLMVVDMVKNPSKNVPKINPNTRKTKGLSLPMILLSTIQVIREVDDDPLYVELADEVLEIIFRDFVKPDEKAVFETVGENGERLDSPQGRCINPGHSIETAWFLMHEGIYRRNSDLIKRAVEILDWSLEIGWDKEFGGLLYFVDIEGKPAEQLEWDMKLWWPHTEALYALLLAYDFTKDSKYEEWFDKIHDYSFSHFEDKEYGEWYGYLHRDGSVSNTLKGSLWKGPFHLPRALLLCAQQLKRMSQGL